MRKQKSFAVQNEEWNRELVDEYKGVAGVKKCVCAGGAVICRLVIRLLRI